MIEAAGRMNGLRPGFVQGWAAPRDIRGCVVRRDDSMAIMIKKVGVIGSGQMGNGIAHVAALAGFDVVLNDVSADRLKSGMATINGNVGISREQDIDRRQRLIIHVPAAMQRVVERCVNRRRRAIAAGSGERAPEIDPVEAQDYVGLRDDVGGLARQQHAGRSAMQRMIGRKGGADLEVGEHARAEQLCERDALVPTIHAAADAPDQDHRILRRLQQACSLLMD